MKVEISSPFPFEALPRIWRWVEHVRHRVADDFGPKTLAEFMDQARVRWDQQKTWAVYGDGELGGLITFERLSPWLGTAHWILKPEFQGRGAAGTASRAAITEMFAEGIGKLSIYQFAGNHAMASLLVSLGAKREGTLENQTVSNGKPIDLWVYGLSKEAFDEALAKFNLALSGAAPQEEAIAEPTPTRYLPRNRHKQISTEASCPGQSPLPSAESLLSSEAH